MIFSSSASALSVSESSISSCCFCDDTACSVCCNCCNRASCSCSCGGSSTSSLKSVMRRSIVESGASYKRVQQLRSPAGSLRRIAETNWMRPVMQPGLELECAWSGRVRERLVSLKICSREFVESRGLLTRLLSWRSLANRGL